MTEEPMLYPLPPQPDLPTSVAGQIAESAEDEARILRAVWEAAAAGAGEGEPVSAATLPAEGEEAAAGSAPAAAEGASL